MQPVYLQPCSDLKFLIKNYVYLHSDVPIKIVDKHIPRGDISVILNFKGDINIIHPQFIPLPPYFIAPNLKEAITLDVSGCISSLIIIFKPSVLSRLLDFDFILTPNQIIKELPFNFFDSLWRDLCLIDEPFMKISFFEESLLKHIDHQLPYKPDEIDLLYDKIQSKSITCPHYDFIIESGINPRSLRRNFKKRVGLSTKNLKHILRINYLWEKVIFENAINYQDLIFSGGYFDQSHFIKDFKLVTGGSPNYFFKRNLDLVKMISGH